MTTPFFRVRWTIAMRETAVVYPLQHALVYALLADAVRGDQLELPTGMPEDLLLDAPERCRIELRKGESFSFGATLVEADRDRASRRIQSINDGLQRIGREAPLRPVPLGGNFDLVEVVDLVSDDRIDHDGAYESIPLERISDEVSAITALPELTLRFTSPLRLERPVVDADRGHRHVDKEWFHPGHFVRQVQKRLAQCDIRRGDGSIDPPLDDAALELVDNRLVWLDMEYGARHNRKSLGGATGRVKLRVRDPLAAAVLVWGQYARVGRNLRFGLGGYRVEELGLDPFVCSRSQGLLELGGDSVARLTQAVDRLFESSAFAWRKGLGRDASARRYDRLLSEDWKFAVRADFDGFFATVDRSFLKDRAEVWLGDDGASAAIIAQLEANAKEIDASLRSKLQIMLLEEFDEYVERGGFRLLRRHDEFYVLARMLADAERLLHCDGSLILLDRLG